MISAQCSECQSEEISEKAGLLVTGIKNKVKLNPKNYHKLIRHFHQDTRMYGDIADILGTRNIADKEVCLKRFTPQQKSLNHKQVIKKSEFVKK